MATVADLYEQARTIGEDQGWDDPDLLALMLLAAYERGPAADAAHAEQVLTNYVSDTC